MSQEIKVFISCPSDVDKEKEIILRACDVLSDRIFSKKKINIKSIDWAKDVPRIITGEGPQNLIDKYLEGQDYDIYIGILWKRFGEPHPNGLAPTEGEFEDAFRRYKKTGKPLITFFFKEEKFYPHDEYEISQFSSVQKFKKRIKPLGLYDSFTRELEFIEKAFVCVQDFVEKLTTTKDSQISFERIKFPEVKDYIPRKVYPANEYKPDEFWIIGDELKKDIINIVKLKNRIALIGDAGSGKTFELQRIANYFSEENSPFYPLLIRLNTFTNQSIEQILPENWREIPENQLLIIFDGLDEIESKNKKDTVRKIEYFSEQHQATSIIVSCRTNFYQTEDSQSSGTLKGFEAYRLLDLEFVQINFYVRLKLSSKANRFFNEINKQQIGQLLNIPFYLVKVVELFEIKNALPNRKAAIFEQLFLARIRLDEEHFRTTLELDEYRDTIIKNLERIALGMETLGRNYISDDEFREIVPDVPLQEMFKYCTAWKKTEGETIIWQFEHNSIQEYLAARVLSRQHINVIKNFVSFKPEYKKIIPSWVNAVSFLLSVSDDSSLLDWILEVEPEICLKFEPDKIKKAQRIKIFKDIFNRYKEKQIWIDRDKFRYDELGRFGQLDEIIDFLLSEIEVVKHYTTLSNAIEILGTMRPSHSFKGRASDLLIRAALDKLDIEITEHVQQDALRALSDLKINSKEVVKQIVSELRDSKSDWVRYGLYYFLHTSEHLDEYIDIFLEGIIYARFYVSSANIQRSRLGNERFELVEGLKKVKSPEAIIKVVSYFIDHEKDLHDLFIGKHDVSFLAENASIAYSKDPSILDLAVNFSLSILDNQLNEEAGQFIRFFENTDTRLLAFQKALGEKSHYKEDLLAALANDQCLEYIIEQYEQENITEDDIWRFLQTLRWKNKDLFPKFYKLINEKFDNAFILPPERDYEKERKEHTQRDFNLLFNKQSVIDEIGQIFKIEKKQSFTRKELIKLRANNWPNLYYSDLGAQILRTIAGDEKVTLENAINAIEKWDWDWFCISKIYEKLTNNEEINISKEQRDWVARWCHKNLEKVDFKNAITKTDKNSYGVRWNAIYIWYLFRKLSLGYPKHILLDMLSFDHDRDGIEYLEEHLDEAEVSARILENLDDGIIIDDVLKNHIDYCKRYGIKEGLKFALQEIVNPDREKHDEIRRVALKTVCKLSDSPTELEELLPDITDDFKWEVLDKLIKNNSNPAHEFLLKLFRTAGEPDRFKAAEYLIKLQDLNALAYYVDWIRKKQNFSRSSLHTSPLPALHTIEAVVLLIELLEISYQKNFEQSDHFDRLERIVLNTLTTIALQSDQAYCAIRESIESFIIKFKSVYKNVNWLYSFLEQLEQKYYVNKSEKNNINDVISKLEKILI